jgi:fumarate reductase subunit D
MRNFQFEPKDIKVHKFWAAIGYVGILCFIPYLFRRHSAFVRSHSKQAVVLFIFEFLGLLLNAIPIVGTWLSGFSLIFALIVSSIAAYRALSGDFWEIPFVFNYSKKLYL